mgnify:CR=1 FL=1
MQTLCQRDANDVCTQCRTVVPVGFHRACPAKKQGQPIPKGPGLGDLTRQFFESMGITEERYKAVKEAVHLDPSCRCNARQEWLNAVGEQLGLSEAAAKFAHWFTSRRGSNAN